MKTILLVAFVDKEEVDFPFLHLELFYTEPPCSEAFLYFIMHLRLKQRGQDFRFLIIMSDLYVGFKKCLSEHLILEKFCRRLLFEMATGTHARNDVNVVRVL